MWVGQETMILPVGPFLTSTSHSVSCLLLSIPPHFWALKQDSWSTVPSCAYKVVGIHYQALASWSIYLQAIPSAVQAAVNAAWMHSQQCDWGNVQYKNSHTIDSQATTHFASWLGTIGYNDQTVQLLVPPKAPCSLRAAYMSFWPMWPVTFGLASLSSKAPCCFSTSRQPPCGSTPSWGWLYQLYVPTLRKIFHLSKTQLQSFQVGLPTRQA